MPRKRHASFSDVVPRLLRSGKLLLAVTRVQAGAVVNKKSGEKERGGAWKRRWETRAKTIATCVSVSRWLVGW